jgi:hypothetical protein
MFSRDDQDRMISIDRNQNSGKSEFLIDSILHNKQQQQHQHQQHHQRHHHQHRQGRGKSKPMTIPE